jgi:hypothetical protein
MTDYSAAAQGIAAGVLAAITAAGLVGRRAAVATTAVTYAEAGVRHTVQPGKDIPEAAIRAHLVTNGFRRVYLPFLRMLVVGKDNRTSTSKLVALAWTYAIVFGLLAIIVAKWLGTPAGYNRLIKHGLRAEYFLFLGGPYAAAVLAKYKAQSSTDKTVGAIGSANAKQLITDDAGDVDLGDFQYILFNALALAFYLGTLIPHLQSGMPRLPSLLTGLALTSAGGYTAKQLAAQAAPQLLSLLPPVAARNSEVEVWGNNLIVPANVAPSGSPIPPKVTVAGVVISVASSEQTLGADHLTVEIPPNAQPGQAKLGVVRADGVPAVGPGGTDSLAVTIT